MRLVVRHGQMTRTYAVLTKSREQCLFKENLPLSIKKRKDLKVSRLYFPKMTTATFPILQPLLEPPVSSRVGVQSPSSLCLGVFSQVRQKINCAGAGTGDFRGRVMIGGKGCTGLPLPLSFCHSLPFMMGVLEP